MPVRPQKHRPTNTDTKSQHDERRGSSTQRGYDATWQKLRLVVLNAEPLCRKCKESGNITEATEVDHIIPISKGGARLCRCNLQPLCKTCHSRKTGKEKFKDA